MLAHFRKPRMTISTSRLVRLDPAHQDEVRSSFRFAVREVRGGLADMADRRALLDASGPGHDLRDLRERFHVGTHVQGRSENAEAVPVEPDQHVRHAFDHEHFIHQDGRELGIDVLKGQKVLSEVLSAVDLLRREGDHAAVRCDLVLGEPVIDPGFVGQDSAAPVNVVLRLQNDT